MGQRASRASVRQPPVPLASSPDVVLAICCGLRVGLVQARSGASARESRGVDHFGRDGVGGGSSVSPPDRPVYGRRCIGDSDLDRGREGRAAEVEGGARYRRISRAHGICWPSRLRAGVSARATSTRSSSRALSQPGQRGKRPPATTAGAGARTTRAMERLTSRLRSSRMSDRVEIVRALDALSEAAHTLADQLRPADAGESDSSPLEGHELPAMAPWPSGSRLLSSAP